MMRRIVLLWVCVLLVPAVWAALPDEEPAAPAKKPPVEKKAPAPKPKPRPQPKAPSRSEPAEESAPRSGRSCAECPEMVRIPVVEFIMGTEDGGPLGNEGPRHGIRVTRAFYLGRYEVTQGQWRRVMGSNPSRFKDCGDDCPVEQVSYDDVQGYIFELNRLSGRRYRLPSEAEWEYACRSGGREQEYCGGEDVDRLGWYGDNSGGKTQRVGRKAPNGLGLYDMSGNVWEWTCSEYSGTYNVNETECSDSGSRVVRCGSWDDSAAWLRSASRFHYVAGLRYGYLGFRLAQDPSL